MKYSDLIRDIKDFPKAGIVFKDITPLLASAEGFQAVISDFKSKLAGLKIDKICGIESRGFLFGAPLALALGVGFVPIRKPGKLPGKTISQEYALEYGTDKLEIHSDAVLPGESVLLVDDVLATGGTAAACVQLLNRLEANLVATAFLMELGFLNGREKLAGQNIVSLMQI